MEYISRNEPGAPKFHSVTEAPPQHMKAPPSQNFLAARRLCPKFRCRCPQVGGGGGSIPRNGVKIKKLVLEAVLSFLIKKCVTYKSFLGHPIPALEFLKIFGTWGQVSYKQVSYKKECKIIR